MGFHPGEKDMAEKEAVATHVKAAKEYLEAAKTLIEANQHFAAVLCTATGMERAAMALILHLGARPATRHRHHEILRTLQSLIQEKHQKEYQETTETIAELMGHLTIVRYKLEAGGQYKTPKELYNQKTARQLYNKAKKAISFIESYIQSK